MDELLSRALVNKRRDAGDEISYGSLSCRFSGISKWSPMERNVLGPILHSRRNVVLPRLPLIDLA